MFKKLLPLLPLLCLCAHAYAQDLVNDRQIRIQTSADVSTKRAALIEHVWGEEGFPAAKLPRLPIAKNDESPVPGLTDLERVDTLIVDMEAGVRSYAHHFIPRVRNGRLVILHSGHFSSFNDSTIPADVDHGMRRTLEGLLGDGYSVLAVYMPRNAVFNTTMNVSEDGGYDAHNALFLEAKYQPRLGSPLKYFLEPIAAYLNYLTTRAAADNFPVYSDFSMVGISGGGWTATVYPAIDTRITISVSVAGSLPLYLRSGASVGDAEQTSPAFYSIAGYPELYVMASHGTGRKQVQILNRFDWSCFSEVHHNPELAGGLSFTEAVRQFESNVRDTLINIGNSDLFAVEIDEAAPGHNITWDAIYDTILPELNESRRYVATATGAEAIARGNRGTPAIFMNGSWSPSKIPAMIGTPALLRGSVSIYDMFYRTGANQLVHVSRPPMTWSRPRVLLDKVISDPAAASPGPGRFDVVALGTDYKLYHVSRDRSGTTTEVVSENVKGLGQPTLIASAQNQLDLFFRGWDRKLYHGRKIGSSPWTITDVGGRMIDLPTAVRTSDGGFRAYVRGVDGALWESRRPAGEDTSWSSWESITGRIGAGLIQGSPSAAVVEGAVHVYARAPETKLRKFVLLNGTWSVGDQEGTYAGSPTASVGGTFARTANGSLSYMDGQKWTELGGSLD